ncbi:MAG: hypothetical protein GWO16_09065 [Gammaproteobacteria bacterium]|nr:hypothetical protein [Gammaproteobacteria bacterium]NIR98115.1 hypothetical protein [Gammaproteobacteria bacterium]NIT63807.1 hypothetical protein [Gammaproteobacteria bacterium]NIV20757.1 hypothetical protein [Gammaproteobacteria bacterium]NIX10006.1 hypothetical protein [Gammaproteobacteria bacterium]
MHLRGKPFDSATALCHQREPGVIDPDLVQFQLTAGDKTAGKRVVQGGGHGLRGRRFRAVFQDAADDLAELRQVLGGGIGFEKIAAKLFYDLLARDFHDP